jgi:hypothetical protein
MTSINVDRNLAMDHMAGSRFIQMKKLLDV